MSKRTHDTLERIQCHSLENPSRSYSGKCICRNNCPWLIQLVFCSALRHSYLLRAAIEWHYCLVSIVKSLTSFRQWKDSFMTAFKDADPLSQKLPLLVNGALPPQEVVNCRVMPLSSAAMVSVKCGEVCVMLWGSVTTQPWESTLQKMCRLSGSQPRQCLCVQKLGRDWPNNRQEGTNASSSGSVPES